MDEYNFKLDLCYLTMNERTRPKKMKTVHIVNGYNLKLDDNYQVHMDGRTHPNG